MRRRVWTRWTRWACAAVALVALPVAGCGDDDDAGGGGGGDGAPATQELVIGAGDYRFDLPDGEITGGTVRLVLENGGAEDHHLTIGRVAPDGDAASVAQAIGSGDLSALAGLELVGGPNGVAAGTSGAVTTQLDAGTYVVFCEIPSVVDGVPHSQKGMVATFDVVGGEPAATGTEPDGPTIAISPDGYDVPAGWDGSGPVTVTNGYPGPSEMAVLALADGATPDDVVAFLSGEAPPGPPPFATAGGVTALLPGSAVEVELDLAPGTYVLVSFLPDPATGAPQMLSGLFTPVTIE